jgi:uncharacterized membrane protein
MKIKLLLLIVLSFIIRFIALNQSLWLDEGVTARVIHDYSLTGILTQFSPYDFHPPLYYFFMKAWSSLFGYSEIALRMPSIFFSLGTGWILFLIGGIWPAAFFLLNPLIVYYSQEARMYMMATFFLTVALYYFLKLLLNAKCKIKNSKLQCKIQNVNKYFLFFILSCALAFYTFYGSIFLIITFLIILLIKKKYKNALLITVYLLLITIFLFPLLYQQFQHSRQALQIVSNWSLVLGKANIKNLLLIPLKFSIGRISFYPKIVYYGISLFWTAVVWYYVINGGAKRKMFLFLLLTPLLLGFLASFISPLLQYFRFLYLIPIFSLLINYGINNKFYKYLITFSFLLFTFIYLFFPQFHREDWKSLAQSLPKNTTVVMILSSSDPLIYYRNDLKLISYYDLNDRKVIPDKIIVIPYTTEIYGIDYKKILHLQNYKQIDIKTFRELSYETWSKLH